MIFVKEAIGVTYGVKTRVNGEGDGGRILLAVSLKKVLEGDSRLSLTDLLLIGQEEFSL